MKGKLILGVGVVVLAVVIGVVVLNRMPAQATDDLGPGAVVTRFYGWYLDYIGEGETRQNPLVDRAYRSSELLSEGFIAEIDETLASFGEGPGFDPILRAQDVPVRIEVGEATVDGDEASVTVEMFWGGNPTPSERVVTLELIDGAWKITGVANAE